MVKGVAPAPSRGEVFLVELDPTPGTAIRKTRPCVIVSPDELNHHLRTSIVAPLTTGGYRYPFRVACRFAGKRGQVVLDHVRTVDHGQLTKRLGALPPATLNDVLRIMGEMFEP